MPPPGQPFSLAEALGSWLTSCCPSRALGPSPSSTASASPPLPARPLLGSHCPSSKKHTLIGKAGGKSPAPQHSPSTAASCSLRRCSRARTAGLCMHSSAPPLAEPSRFTNCRADGRSLLRACGSLGTMQVVCSGGPPWLCPRGIEPITKVRVPTQTQHCPGFPRHWGHCLHTSVWWPYGPKHLHGTESLPTGNLLISIQIACGQ